ncbi:MAG TPA: methyltransferase [Kamptonema sp.]|nr:methyltransferase [Kamptonema sp.]
MNLDSAESSVVKAFIENKVKFPEHFKTNICEDDEMYLYSLSNLNNDRDRALVRYYAIGSRILDSVKQVVEWHFDKFENVSSFLDFACGYGRFTRFLIQELPPERVWVSDIYANAVKFQEEYFGVNGIVSTTKPEDYAVERKFDCILACSFFSHMPEKTFVNWMQNLYDLLSPQGLMMFSVLDMELLPSHVEVPPSGIVFSPLSESRSLDKEEYGTTYVTEEYVNKILDRVSGGKAVVHRIPKGISRYQDLYLVSNEKVKDFSTLNFRHHPEGYLEIGYITPNGKIHLEGWAAEFNDDGRIEEVQVLVNGQLMQKCRPFDDREDVADYFRTKAALHSGWSCYLGRGTVFPEDVLMIKAINNSGLEWIIENNTLASILSLKRSQTELLSTEAKLEQAQAQLGSTQEKLEETNTELASVQEKLEETNTKLALEQKNLEETKAELASVGVQLKQTQIELANSYQEQERSQFRIGQLNSRIMAMESSKFWKLRAAWFRVKRAIGLNVENE